MIDQERVRAIATPLLEAARNGGVARAVSFKPQPDDFARVFTEQLAPIAAQHYTTLWSQPVEITARPENTQLVVVSSLAEELKDSSAFPGGYKNLTGLLPGRVWLAWKYVRPGESLGMSYDGLVFLEDRFAWFPKPWRLQRSSDPFYVD